MKNIYFGIFLVTTMHFAMAERIEIQGLFGRGWADSSAAVDNNKAGPKKKICSPYKFDPKKCKTVNDRQLCGYNMNHGEISDKIVPYQFPTLTTKCGVRGGRIECGYADGPYEGIRRPPIYFYPQTKRMTSATNTRNLNTKEDRSTTVNDDVDRVLFKKTTQTTVNDGEVNQDEKDYSDNADSIDYDDVKHRNEKERLAFIENTGHPILLPATLKKNKPLDKQPCNGILEKIMGGITLLT